MILRARWAATIESVRARTPALQGAQMALPVWTKAAEDNNQVHLAEALPPAVLRRAPLTQHPRRLAWQRRGWQMQLEGRPSLPSFSALRKSVLRLALPLHDGVRLSAATLARGTSLVVSLTESRRTLSTATFHLDVESITVIVSWRAMI